MERVKFVLETKQGGSASQDESYHFVACLVELYQPTANPAGQRRRAKFWLRIWQRTVRMYSTSTADFARLHGGRERGPTSNGRHIRIVGIALIFVT